MIATPRSSWPSDLERAATTPELGLWEGMAAEAYDRLTDYARDRPMEFGLWALGIGFVLGWKLKPW